MTPKQIEASGQIPKTMDKLYSVNEDLFKDILQFYSHCGTPETIAVSLIRLGEAIRRLDRQLTKNGVLNAN